MNSKSALAEQHATYKAECACPGPQDPHRRRKSSGVASEHPQAEDKAGPLSWCRATSLNKAVRRLTTEMNAVISVVVAVVVVVVMAGPVCSGPLQRSRRWSVHAAIREPAPSLAVQQLVDVLATSPDIRYSDWHKKLTAVKNSKFKACFIVDLDPDFNLQESEMYKTTSENVPQVIDSPPAYLELQQKAGPYITPMCEHMDIYWLNVVAPPLPVGNNHYVTLPEPIRVRVNDTPLPIMAVEAPPPVGVYRQQQAEQTSGPKAPPPLPLYRQQQAEQTSGPKAPPPLSLYRQEEANRNVPQTERVAVTPPPLALWKLQNGN